MCMQNKSTNTRMHVKLKIKYNDEKKNDKEEIEWERNRETEREKNSNKQTKHWLCKQNTVCSSLIITLFYSVILIFYGERFIIMILQCCFCFFYFFSPLSLGARSFPFIVVAVSLETRRVRVLFSIFGVTHAPWHRDYRFPDPVCVLILCVLFS